MLPLLPSASKESAETPISNNEVKETPKVEVSSTDFQKDLVDIHCKIEKSLRTRMRVYCAKTGLLLQDFHQGSYCRTARRVYMAGEAP